MPPIRARKSSWDINPFGDIIQIPYTDVFSRPEYETIQLGLVPEVMEDKWFFYFEDQTLFVHHSWTGEPAFKVQFKVRENDVLVERAYQAFGSGFAGVEYQASLLEFLIGNLLLDRNLPFPKLGEAQGDIPGVEQHMISGTAYTERTFSTKKKPN